MKIFVISLQDDIERRTRASSILSKHSFDYEFFDAVDGRKGLPDDLISLPNDQHRIVFRSRVLTPGEKGCYASHYRLWQKCVEVNEPIIILEDDFKDLIFFKEVIGKLPSLHEHYDYLRLEYQHDKMSQVEYLHDIQLVLWHDNSKGTTAYSISPAAAKRFLNASESWLCSVDNFIGESFRHQVPSIGVLPCAAFPPFDLGSRIQSHNYKTKVPLYFKATRELYRFYRFLRMSIWNGQCLRKHHKAFRGEHL